MGDDDHGVVEIDQEFLEPGDRVEIEVVRRLVEQKNVRISEQGLREQNLDLLGAEEILHQRVVELRLDTEAVQQRGGVGLRLPAVHVRKFRLELARADAVLLGEILLRIDRVLLLHNLIEPCISHDDRVQHRIFIVAEMGLLQEGDALAGRDRDFALRAVQLAGEDLQEGGLAGAVRADQTVAVPLGEFDIHILKEGFLADSKRYIVCRYHKKLLYFQAFSKFYNRFSIIRESSCFFKRNISGSCLLVFPKKKCYS